MLTSQQLAEVVEYLRAHGLCGGSEKRRATRMQVQAKVLVGRVVDGKLVQSFSSLTKDISLHGVGLIQGLVVDPGQELILNLPRTKGLPVYVRARICHCRDLAEGLFSVGAEFVATVSKELADALEQSGEAELLRIRRSILAN